MTTGRINQVTIGGRGSARPTHKMRLPAARHPPHGLGCPRFAKPNTRLSCKASHTVRQRRDDHGLPCGRSSPAPVLSALNGVGPDLHPRTHESLHTRNGATPQCHCRHRTGRRKGTPLPSATAHSQICSASQAMPLPGRPTAHGTPAISSAEQRPCRTEAHLATNSTAARNRTLGSLSEHTPHGGQLT